MRSLDYSAQANAPKPPRARPNFFGAVRFAGRAIARVQSWLWALENGGRAADRAKANRPWSAA